MSNHPVKRIGLLMDRLVGFNHEVLQGIRDFATPRREWMCHFAEPRPEHLAVVEAWDPDGLVVFLFNQEMESRLIELGKPFVDVANWLPASTVPRVSVDDIAIGRMAADHLLDLGLERFAFVGRTRFVFSRSRQRGFEELLAKAGFGCDLYTSSADQPTFARAWTMGGASEEMLHWLRGLFKPIGVFAENDECALMVSEACYAGGIDVPTQVAILGVDNDPYLGSLGYPPISSIATPARRLGYEAAVLLDRLMDGQRAPAQAIVLPPIGVVSRRSTDMLAIGDPLVAEAVRLIREKACHGLTVPEVVKHSPVGRRTMEKLFRQHIGRSPLEEIRRVRLARAQSLLATTDLSIDTVAQRSGFGSASWLTTTFSNEFETTPRAYRVRMQGEP